MKTPLISPGIRGNAFAKRDKLKTLLISAPWRFSNWPSIAISQLKSYAETKGCTVVARHLHMEIACELGLSIYDRISKEWEIGECIYSCLLFPGEADELIAKVAGKLRSQKNETLAHWLETSAINEVAAASHKVISSINFDEYALVGFSVGALQLMSSLYLASLVKARNPSVTIVFGGSGIIGSVGQNLAKSCSYIDYVVDGEGEEALVGLMAYVGAPAAHDHRNVANLWHRHESDGLSRTGQRNLSCMDSLPHPDYSEYFSFAKQRGFPLTRAVLPIEASRGCLWEHRCGDEKIVGCTFCGLYRNSPDYREKSLQYVLQEIRANTDRFSNLNLSFVDAYLPASFRNQLLQSIIDSNLDVSIFCEMRCDMDDETGRLFFFSNMRRVQLGVEAFSNRILKKLEKGTKTIDNVNSIKICMDYGVPFQYNILTRVPGVTADEVNEMMETMPCLFALQPPSVSELVLDRGSRMYQEPEKYNIDPKSIDAVPLSFLPRELVHRGVTQTVLFDSPDMAPWTELENTVDKWRSVHEQAKKLGFKSALVFREGSSFLTIIDLRSDDLLYYNIDGDLKTVLLACDRKISMAQLAGKVTLEKYSLDEVVEVLLRHRLLLQDGNFLISLALRENMNKRLNHLPNQG